MYIKKPEITNIKLPVKGSSEAKIQTQKKISFRIEYAYHYLVLSFYKIKFTEYLLFSSKEYTRPFNPHNHTIRQVLLILISIYKRCQIYFV